MQLDTRAKAQLHIRRHVSIVAVAVLLACIGAADSSGADRVRVSSDLLVVTENENPIGQCWMEPDGTIVLDLRRTGDGIHISMPLQRFSPSDRQYSEVLRHVGPLRPGEVKLVRPWPEKQP
jgi:hypothetical protein